MGVDPRGFDGTRAAHRSRVAPLVKAVVWFALILVPGAFVALLAYVAARLVKRSWERTAAFGPASSTEHLRQTVAELRIADVAKEARALLVAH